MERIIIRVRSSIEVERNCEQENGKEEIPLDTEVSRLKTQYGSHMMEDKSCWNRLHYIENI